ncbi:AMP-binding protein [Paracoccaceae bacterium]|jgi:acyl-CoA synthetase (AMP-forming)/AMP-acid ligase II|nr:AMP-binding protein [Paracoccaceae bacterium]MBT6546416.1 AMP-binding protein [Paracoccaceae bacterium]MDB3911049.1 AMP-binding protein [Paracoccaceae bacterium]|tara:strand:+ start:6094 stop:7584 length:1491 start_codon:yes stop_codon:yes gene_type:complete
MILDTLTPPQGTVRDWLNHRANQGGVAMVFPETSEDFQWTDILKKAAAIAKHLTAMGVSKGESVAIIHPNGPEGITALYGVLYGGYRATMINLAAGRDAINYALTHSGARFAFVHDSAMALYNSAAPDGVVVINEYVESNAPLHVITPQDHALLMYTSGTTGRPKGVVHSHASLLAGGWTTAIAHELSPKDRGLCVLPIYHINGLCVSVMGSLVSGGSLSVISKFSASKFWSQTSGSAATWFSVVPTIISHLLHGAADPNPDCISRLRFGRSASSALAIETQRAFENRFKIPIVETMGLTETAAQILSNPLPPSVRKIGSPGIGYGNTICILAPDQSKCPPDTEGEIAVRGPNVMIEYLNNPEATKDTFSGDWLRTGDLGRMDAEGYAFVTGRIKELIIKGGENIAPREIDEALYTHPDIVEAAAFARPCKTYGERVEAAVRISEGSRLQERDLVEICRQRLGAFKTPDVIHFLTELPKGPSGKIQRLKLAEFLGK